jgi:hypothetical protein
MVEIWSDKFRARRVAALIVTERRSCDVVLQSPLSSVSSNSQSSAAARACSSPSRTLTATTNAASSFSARLKSSASISTEAVAGLDPSSPAAFLRSATNCLSFRIAVLLANAQILCDSLAEHDLKNDSFEAGFFYRRDPLKNAGISALSYLKGRKDYAALNLKPPDAVE